MFIFKLEIEWTALTTVFWAYGFCADFQPFLDRLQNSYNNKKSPFKPFRKVENSPRIGLAKNITVKVRQYAILAQSATNFHPVQVWLFFSNWACSRLRINSEHVVVVQCIRQSHLGLLQLFPLSIVYSGSLRRRTQQLVVLAVMEKLITLVH